MKQDSSLIKVNYILYKRLIREWFSVKELAKLWVSEINRSNSIRLMLKELHFSFCIITDYDRLYLSIEDDSLQLLAEMDVFPGKRLIGKEEIFCSIFSGQRKLRQAVDNNEIESTLTFREQLLLESLFYLAG